MHLEQLQQDSNLRIRDLDLSHAEKEQNLRTQIADLQQKEEKA